MNGYVCLNELFDWQRKSEPKQGLDLETRQVTLVAPSMYFENAENKIFTPLKNAHKNKKDDDKPKWQKAYQSVKHNRVKEFENANVGNLLHAMCALFLLNILYFDCMMTL